MLMLFWKTEAEIFGVRLSGFAEPVLAVAVMLMA